MIELTAGQVNGATSVKESSTLTVQTVTLGFGADNQSDISFPPFTLVMRRGTASGAPMPTPLFDPGKTYRITIEEETS